MSFRLLINEPNKLNGSLRNLVENSWMGEAIPFMLLAIQFGLQPTLNRAFIANGTSNSSLIIMTEFIKILLSIAVIWVSTTSEARSQLIKEFSLSHSLQRAGGPAFLYSIQNWLILLGSKHISPLTLSLLNQTKTLSAALFAYVILGKRQSMVQLIALAGLFLGASLIIGAERNTTKTSGIDTNASTLTGITVVSLASILSGVSSAATEWVLNRTEALDAPKAVASLLFSMELALFGIVSLVGTALLGWNPDVTLFTDPFKNWTIWTYIPVFANASGGILVGIVTQRAGGVKKGVSLILGICLATVVEGIIGQKSLTMTHVLAVGLVLLSMWTYFTNPPLSSSSSSSLAKEDKLKQS